MWNLTKMNFYMMLTTFLWMVIETTAWRGRGDRIDDLKTTTTKLTTYNSTSTPMTWMLVWNHLQTQLHTQVNETFLTSRCKDLVDLFPILFQDTTEISPFFTQEDLAIIQELLLISHRTSTMVTATIQVVILVLVGVVALCCKVCTCNHCKKGNPCPPLPRTNGFRAFTDSPTASVDGDTNENTTAEGAARALNHTYANEPVSQASQEVCQLFDRYHDAHVKVTQQNQKETNIRLNRMADNHNSQMKQISAVMGQVFKKLDALETQTSRDMPRATLPGQQLFQQYNSLPHMKQPRSHYSEEQPLLDNQSEGQSEGDFQQQETLRHQHMAAAMGVNISASNPSGEDFKTFKPDHPPPPPPLQPKKKGLGGARSKK